MHTVCVSHPQHTSNMFPVRCYSCNSVLGHKWSLYNEQQLKGVDKKSSFEQLGVVRLCCRRMFLGHVDLTSENSAYPNKDILLDKAGTVLKREAHKTRLFLCD